MLKMLSRDSVRLSAWTPNEKLVPLNSVQLSPHGKKTIFSRNVLRNSPSCSIYKNIESVTHAMGACLDIRRHVGFLDTPKHVRRKLILTHLDRSVLNS